MPEETYTSTVYTDVTKTVTNGGVMSFSHAGLAQLLQKPISAVQQLRGEYPAELTVPDARVALTSNSNRDDRISLGTLTLAA